MPGLITSQTPTEQSKARKPTKNELRRAKKKAQKHDQPNANDPIEPVAPLKEDPIQAVPDVIIESDDPLFAQFAGVFAKFQEDNGDSAKQAEKAEVVFDNDDDNIQDEDEEAETKRKLSKKARKAASKLSVAELKAIVQKPEVVEWTDVTSQDPKLLVNIKAMRNVVPVPNHWSLKREYLSSKRGVEKQNFRLPGFIAETGIAEMRQSGIDDQADSSLKQKARDRVNPKMNRLDIDYKKLYDAFFRRQTKPHMTRYGELYYEGKEHETDLKHLRPGDISDGLREALNMPHNAPPPWLINMQKFGCPPSYPAMKIPGVNAPLPPGGRWGFEPGQYGKPPVTDDYTLKPLWGGDLFGHEEARRIEERKRRKPDKPVDRRLWGELQEVPDEEEEEEDEEEEEEEEQAVEEEGREEEIGETGLQTPFEIPGSVAPSDFHLRKQRDGIETEDHGPPRQAGQVLREKAIRTEGFFGGDRAYQYEAQPSPAQDDRGTKRKAKHLESN